jgi:8-oxo-dGTP diphosphatase
MPWAAVVTKLQSDEKDYVDVSAGILADDEGRVLITQRLGDGPMHGLWEFPGGKIAAGESAESALVRELCEEISVDVLHYASFMSVEHDYPDRSVRLQFFIVDAWQGEAVGVEGQRIRWVLPAEIDPDSILPADKPVIAALLAGGISK